MIGLRFERRNPRDFQQGLVGSVVFRFARCRFLAGEVIVEGLSECREAMGLAAQRVSLDASVGYVTDCLRHDAEGRRGLDPSHGAGERYSNELGLTFELWEQSR